MLRWFVAMGVVLGALVTPALGNAQDSTQLDEAARLTFESAREAFVAGDYETALARFRQAYELSARPGLLYNIAQTLDRLRRDEETVTALREYLEAAPDAPNRAEVEARIRVLERAIAERGTTAPSPDPDPSTGTSTGSQGTAPPPPPPEDDGLAILHPAIFITAAGLAVAGGVLTIWAGLETLSLNDRYTSNDDPLTVGDDYDEALTYQTMTNVFIGTTALFAVAAGVLAVFTDWDALGGGSSDSAALRPVLNAGPTGASLGAEGRF